MRIAARVACIALCATAAGCGGGGGGGESHIVRITSESSDSSRTSLHSAVDHPIANGKQIPLTAVLPLVPEPLPARAKQESRCPVKRTVTIEFESGRSLSYGPCGLPQSIEWLAGAIEGQARQWSPRLVDHPLIVGALPAERRALAELLRAFAPTPIRRVEFRPPRSKDGNNVDWKVVTGTSSRGYWEAELLVRLYRGAALRAHLRPVERMNSAEGSGPITASGIGPAAGSLEPVRRVLANTHARIVEVRRIHGALELTVRTANAAAFLKYHGKAFLRALGKPAGASVFFALQDAYGAVVYGGGWVPGMGMTFGRADLGSCSPIIHSGIFGYTPPPCPA